MKICRKGLFAAALAFTSWGLLPLYWKELSGVPAEVVIAHRVLWSFVFVIFVQLLGYRWLKAGVVQVSLRTVAMLILSGVVISGNWLIYVLAIQSGNVLESSLGYFITPLLNVLLGALLFRERLRVQQVAILSLAAAGVSLAAVAYGRIPYYGLALALTMACYGVLRKRSAVPAIDALSIEMLSIVSPAILFLYYAPRPGSVFGVPAESWNSSSALLLIGTGCITVVPLLWFSYAAKQLPLYALGLMQYLSPTLQFLLAVFVFGEAFDATRAIAFSFIWLAILLFVVESRWRNIFPLPFRQKAVCAE